MIEKKIYRFIDYALLFMSMALFIAFFGFDVSNLNVLGIFLLVLNIYLCIKSIYHKKTFFLFLVMFYFNFSFVISRYIGESSSILDAIFSQITNSSSFVYTILMQILVFTILNFFVKQSDFVLLPKREEVVHIFKYRKILIFILQLMLCFILIYHYFFHITVATTLLEYSIFLFIFTLYFSKHDRMNRLITEFILLLFACYSLLNGDRIAVLQFLLADFLINYLERLKIRHILMVFSLGVFLFTLFGLYGDYIDYNKDLNSLSFSLVVDELKDRRFALDTAVSSYFTTTSMVDVSSRYSTSFRVNDGISYFTKYSVMGRLSGYVLLPYTIRNYQMNYGGGYFVGYFYFWFSWFGVVFIGIYLSFLIRKVIMSFHSNYKTLLGIFIISMIPRWFLYEPNMLFRGIVLFSIVYYFVFKLFVYRK